MLDAILLLASKSVILSCSRCKLLVLTYPNPMMISNLLTWDICPCLNSACTTNLHCSFVNFQTSSFSSLFCTVCYGWRNFLCLHNSLSSFKTFFCALKSTSPQNLAVLCVEMGVHCNDSISSILYEPTYFLSWIVMSLGSNKFCSVFTVEHLGQWIACGWP